MKTKRHFILLLLFLLTISIVVASCSPTPQYLRKQNIRVAGQNRFVKVLILKTRETVSIEASARLKIRDGKTGRILYDAPKAALRINPGKIRQGLMMECSNSIISVNNKEYRGRIELKNLMGKILVINHIDLENYIKSVVPGEVPSSWPIETLKAQAVAARTYTLYHLSKQKDLQIYDLDATTNFQVYKGKSVEKPETTRAVNLTHGEYLIHGYQPVLAYFHSTCGGRTIDDRYVWNGKDMPYLQGTSCSYCSMSPNYNWETRISLEQMQSALRRKYSSMGKIKRISFKKKAGRIALVQIGHTNGTINITGNNFRLMFPLKTVKSLYFNSRKSGHGLQLQGHGWGHGVGMCQWGAKGMAMKGFSYRKILSYYYKNVRLYRGNYRNVARKNSRSTFFN